MRTRLLVVLIACIMPFFFSINSLNAQDSAGVGARPLSPEESMIADSIFRDIGTAVIEGVPPTSLFGNRCEITFMNNTVDGPRKLAYDICLAESREGRLGRIRFFDVRQGRPRRELFVVVIRERDNTRACEIHIDRGFSRGEDPNGELFYYRERLCGETRPEINGLILQFMNRP